MEEGYQPQSDFVWLAASGDAPLEGCAEAASNLSLLIAFTRDPNKSNRDWATLALAMYGPDSPEVLEALIQAADDVDCDVRAEAIEGIAKRNAKAALSLVRRDLSNSPCGYGVFVAAAILADRSLVELLLPFDEDTSAPWIDNTIRNAIRACQTGVSIKTH